VSIAISEAIHLSLRPGVAVNYKVSLLIPDGSEIDKGLIFLFL